GLGGERTLPPEWRILRRCLPGPPRRAHGFPAEPESSLLADFRPMRRPEPVRSRGPASVRRDDLLPALRCGLRPACRPAGVAPGHPGPEPPHPARPPANPRRLG